jgi:dethiobiotin synthetase
MEGVDVSLDRIVESYRRLAWESDLVLVEGAGGFLVPISGTAMISDLAKVLAQPVLIISRPNLGSVNHTLLTIRCVRSMGLEVAGVFINKWDEMAAGNAEHSAEKLIEKFGDVRVLAKLPKVIGKDDGEIILSLALWMEKNFDWGFLEP